MGKKILVSFSSLPICAYPKLVCIVFLLSTTLKDMAYINRINKTFVHKIIKTIHYKRNILNSS
jgi:hypothetical protein